MAKEIETKTLRDIIADRDKALATLRTELEEVNALVEKHHEFGEKEHTRVFELEQEVSSWKAKHGETDGHAERQLGELRAELKTIAEDRDTWLGQAREMEDELVRTRESLATITEDRDHWLAEAGRERDHGNGHQQRWERLHERLDAINESHSKSLTAKNAEIARLAGKPIRVERELEELKSVVLKGDHAAIIDHLEATGSTTKPTTRKCESCDRYTEDAIFDQETGMATCRLCADGRSAEADSLNAQEKQGYRLGLKPPKIHSKPEGSKAVMEEDGSFVPDVPGGYVVDVVMGQPRCARVGCGRDILESYQERVPYCSVVCELTGKAESRRLDITADMPTVPGCEHIDNTLTLRGSTAIRECNDCGEALESAKREGEWVAIMTPAKPDKVFTVSLTKGLADGEEIDASFEVVDEGVQPHLRDHVPSIADPTASPNCRSYVRKLGTPYEESRQAFDRYAGMSGNELPANEVSALQVLLHRWEAREFQGGGNVEDSTLGVNEETGELSEAFIYLAAMQCGAGRMAHAVLKRKQGIRGFEDPEVYRQAAADAIADVAIFAMQCATKSRLDFWAIVQDTAVQVMERKWHGESEGE